MISRLDSDGDGQLSAAEMAKMEKPGNGKSGKGKSLIERADTDGDGMISKAEAKVTMDQMAKRGGKKGKKGKQVD
jgi:Ca2+-binding EF-hand superfamily protein